MTMKQKIKRFLNNMVVGMFYGVLVAMLLGMVAFLWWLDHVVFVY